MFVLKVPLTLTNQPSALFDKPLLLTQSSSSSTLNDVSLCSWSPNWLVPGTAILWLLICLPFNTKHIFIESYSVLNTCKFTFAFIGQVSQHEHLTHVQLSLNLEKYSSSFSNFYESILQLPWHHHCIFWTSVGRILFHSQIYRI